MTVLEVIVVVIPDTAAELLDLIDEARAVPFELALHARRRRWLPWWVEIERAPIGIYRLPRVGETLESSSPASFEGPLPRLVRWTLHRPDGSQVAEGEAKLPELREGDTLTVSIPLSGAAA